MKKKESKKKELEKNPPFNMKVVRIFIVKSNNTKKRARSYSKFKLKGPSVGVGIFLVNPLEDKILIGRRKDSGLFGLPGGWLEMGEEWEECASRELMEETGLTKVAQTFRHLHTLNSMSMDKNYHNVSCIMYNEVEEQELDQIKNTEPEKCAGWFWVSLMEMRKHINKLFYPLRDFLGKYPDLNHVDYLKRMLKTI